MTTQIDELLGTDVGNYRLIRVLGEGGMGRVYVGEQAAIASRVAIKVLTTKDPDLVARFFAEAKAVNVIKHPGLVKVLALSHLPDGRPYIIMELVEGETLRTLVVRDSPLPIASVLDMMKQLLAALGAAHARNVVHRDLKPDNVMITPDGTVKILDFGIAKLSSTLGGGNLTQIGAQIGTPAYMAPEQIRGEDVDGRTDIYAAGVVLYEALTGRHPFEAKSEYEMLNGHLESPPPRLSARRKDAPAVLEPIIQKALAKKMDDRYASAAELSAALDEAARAAGLPNQRMIARLPVSGPRAFDAFRATLDDYPPVKRRAPTDSPTVDGKGGSDRATLDERPARNVPQRETVEYKRPSEPRVEAGKRPSEPRVEAASRQSATRVEKAGRAQTAPAATASRRWWIPIPIVVAVAAVVAFITWPRGSARVPAPTVSVPLDAAVPAPGIEDAAAPELVVGTETVGGYVQRVTHKYTVVDPKRFDVLANVSKAQWLARQLLPDVVLTGFRVDQANAAGGVGFDGVGVVAYYFGLPGPVPQEPDDFRECIVGVTVSATGFEARTMMAKCPEQVEQVPRCKLADVWQRAIAKGQKRGTARIEWLAGRWLFNGSGPQLEIQDDCSPTAAVTVPKPVAFDAGLASASPADASVPADAPSWAPKGYAVMELPFDFDAEHFDPIAYIPKARANARKLAPDVEVTLFYVEGLRRDGTADLRNAHQTGFQASTVGPADGKCIWVSMAFYNGKITMTKTEGKTCMGAILGPPKCSVAQMFERTKATTETLDLGLIKGRWQHVRDMYDDDCK
ncbi:MAG TPA: serine/threonine-protein kinase [Kofleriaceae bacterium]|nr:serine/threonine-protein kinase [Kofleriaceae bacterium]